MKFPSIKNLADSAFNTVKRFPFEILFALAGTIAQTIHINRETYIEDSFYSKIIMTANVGLLLSLAATLYIESIGIQKKILVRFAISILAVSLFFIFNKQLRNIDYTRFFLLSLAFHLLVAFAAFTARGNIQGFWQFNKTLFLRFLSSVLYSGVLCLGLDTALAASKLLFNLHFDYKTYFILFTWIVGMFNTVFFLSGVPSNISELDNDESYPKGLKVFTQYVLIPLASIYVIILLAYEFKILVQWSLPKGMVSSLILGYAVFGILSILLIYPLRNQEDNKWIKTFSRSFYFLLVPLLILLGLAIVSRILPYGITPMRYFLIILAGWLLFVTLYFLLSRSQNIKIIPVSLCILALISVYGPQSAFSIASYSQSQILINIFKQYHAFNKGKLSSLVKARVNTNDGFKAVEKAKYFVYDNDLRGLQTYITKDINKVIDSITSLRDTVQPVDKQHPLINEYEVKNKEQQWIKQYLGLDKFDRGNTDTVVYYEFTAKNRPLLYTKGYDYALDINIIVRDPADIPTLQTDNISIKQNRRADNVLSLYLNSETVSFDLKIIADSLFKKKGVFGAYKGNDTRDNSSKAFIVPDQLLRYSKQTGHFKITLQLNRLMLNYNQNKPIDIIAVDGSYLISALK